MASNAKRVYSIRRSLWVQRPLTYGDLLKMIRLLRDRLKNVGTERPSIVAIIDSLDADGSMRTLMNLFLKPYEPTILHRAWNWFWMRRAKIDRDGYVLDAMDTPTAARVMADFFLVNWNWYDKLMRSKIGSRSLFRRRMTVSEAITTWTNFYSAIRTAGMGTGYDFNLSQLFQSSAGSSPTSAFNTDESKTPPASS